MQRTSSEVPQRQHNEDRMRRADSWLERSIQAKHAEDEGSGDIENTGLACERFVFLWIAFNAAYGYDLVDEEADDSYPEERMKFEKFLHEIVKLDHGEIIERILWDQYAGPVRVLLNNKYVFQPFWEWVRGSSRGRGWKHKFEIERGRANRALQKRMVHSVLEIVFRRLYVLRNQIFHGGATFGTGWGKDQVRQGSRLMASLVPAVLDIMRADIEANPDTDIWGKVAYPRINESGE